MKIRVAVFSCSNPFACSRTGIFPGSGALRSQSQGRTHFCSCRVRSALQKPWGTQPQPGAPHANENWSCATRWNRMKPQKTKGQQRTTAATVEIRRTSCLFLCHNTLDSLRGSSNKIETVITIRHNHIQSQDITRPYDYSNIFKHIQTYSNIFNAWTYQSCCWDGDGFLYLRAIWSRQQESFYA